MQQQVETKATVNTLDTYVLLFLSPKWCWCAAKYQYISFSKTGIFTNIIPKNVMLAQSLIFSLHVIYWGNIFPMFCISKEVAGKQMENTIMNWNVLFKNCLSAVVKLTPSSWQQITTVRTLCHMFKSATKAGVVSWNLRFEDSVNRMAWRIKE